MKRALAVLPALGLFLGACATPAWRVEEHGGSRVLRTPDERFETLVPAELAPCAMSFGSLDLCGPVDEERLHVGHPLGIKPQLQRRTDGCVEEGLLDEWEVVTLGRHDTDAHAPPRGSSCRPSC